MMQAGVRLRQSTETTLPELTEQHRIRWKEEELSGLESVHMAESDIACAAPGLNTLEPERVTAHSGVSDLHHTHTSLIKTEADLGFTHTGDLIKTESLESNELGNANHLPPDQIKTEANDGGCVKAEHASGLQDFNIKPDEIKCESSESLASDLMNTVMNGAAVDLKDQTEPLQCAGTPKMPKGLKKRKYTAETVAIDCNRSSDEEEMVFTEKISDVSSVDSSAEEDFRDGRDPEFESESDEESDLDELQSNIQTPQKKPRSSVTEAEEEEQPGTSAHFSPPASTSTQLVGRGGERARRARGRGRGRGRSRGSQQARSAAGGGWQGLDQEDITPPRPKFRPRRAPGPQVLRGASYTALQLFQLFMSSTILQTILANTNKYGRLQQGPSWQQITLEDLYSYLAIVIYMGLASLHKITDYWRKSKLYGLPFPPSVMSGRKFQRIAASIHISDPDDDAANNAKRGTADYDRLGKIKPMYDQIREACKAAYHPQQNIVVDERTVASKARANLKQYMRNKPVKWDYRLFVLADSQSGYTWDFFVHEGKSDVAAGKSLSYDLVMHLVSTQALGTGYKLFVDNFYTSPTLFTDLLSKKVWACGTICANRVGFPKSRPGGLDKRSLRGSIRWIREGPLVFIQWRDTKDVLMCSTIHQAHGEDTVRCQIKDVHGQWTSTRIPIPPSIKDYNKNTGGVDVSDALMGYHSVLHKTTKWYRTFFYHFLDIAIVDAYIIQKELAIQSGGKVLTDKAFRETLVMELREAGSTSTATPFPPAPAPTPAPAPPAASHKPNYLATDGTVGRRRCCHCHQKTPVACRTCNVFLCFTSTRDCYNDWHKQQGI